MANKYKSKPVRRKNSCNTLWCEFRHHIPFTALASAIAIVLAILASLYLTHQNTEPVFHWLHFVHVFFSAIATAAVFAKYNNRYILGIFVGIIGSILVGTLSDVILPFIGGFVLGMDIHLHLPIVEAFWMVILFALFGTIIGISTKKSILSHSLHIFLSVFASLFYFISFGNISSIFDLLATFLVLFVAVWLPCCFSDIWFPLLFGGKEMNVKCSCGHVDKQKHYKHKPL